MVPSARVVHHLLSRFIKWTLGLFFTHPFFRLQERDFAVVAVAPSSGFHVYDGYQHRFSGSDEPSSLSIFVPRPRNRSCPNFGWYYLQNILCVLRLNFNIISIGLLSRVVQLLVNGHVLLQWLLLFFVILNQLVIGLSYMMHVTNCQLNINDQLLMLLYPGLLIGVVLLMIYRTVRSPSSCRWKTQQSVYVGLAASFSGAIAGCWVGAGTMVSDDLLPCCLGFGCLATAIVVPLIVLVPNSRPNTSDSLKPHKDVDVKSFSSSSYTSDDGEDSNYGESKKPTGRGSKKAIPAEPGMFFIFID